MDKTILISEAATFPPAQASFITASPVYWIAKPPACSDENQLRCRPLGSAARGRVQRVPRGVGVGFRAATPAGNLWHMLCGQVFLILGGLFNQACKCGARKDAAGPWKSGDNPSVNILFIALSESPK